MSKFIKNILIGIVIILLLYGAYSVLFNRDSSFDGQLVSSKKSEGVDFVDKSLLTLLLELRSIKLDDSIFNSPTFQSLYDFGIEIKSQPVGRDNPFSSLKNDDSYFDRGE